MSNIVNVAARLGAKLATLALLACTFLIPVASATESPTITTIAGNGTFGYVGDGGPATSANLGSVGNLTILPDQRIVFATIDSGRVRQVTPDGIINPYTANGQALVFGPDTLGGLISDAAGNIYIADLGYHRIVKVTPAGVISNFAGTGAQGFSGDGGQAASAQFSFPRDLALAPDGSILVADGGNRRIRKITPAGIVYTFAGSGEYGSTGDGGPATSAAFMSVRAVALDPAGNVYVADEGANRIRKISPDGSISPFAGTGVHGDSGDHGPATSAQMTCPRDVVAHPDGSIYIADTCKSRIRRVSEDGIITTVAGTGVDGYNGDGGLPTSAQLMSPEAIYIDSSGTRLYISDRGNYRVRVATIIPPGPPQAPRFVMAERGNSAASVSFQAPEFDGGADITGYSVTSSPAGGVDTNAGSTALVHAISGLSNDTSYTFTVTASNANGTSSASLPSNAIVPAGVPGSPSITAVTRGSGQVEVSFLPPTITGDSPITGYTVTASPAAGGDAQAGTTGLSHVVTGLQNGTSYTFSVRATNALGTGAPSAPSAAVVPLALPSAPTSVSATAGDGYADITWDQPASWGDVYITGYRITATPGDAVREVSGWDQNLARLYDLQNGTSYTFAVQAMSAEGLGEAAYTNAVTPKALVVPSAPGMVGATIDGGTATVTISASTDDGGSPIHWYWVHSSDCPQALDDDAATYALQHHMINLPPNQPCTFTAVAQNSIGTSLHSAPSNAVTYVLPVLSVADVSVQEGNSGTLNATFNLVLSQASANPVTFNVRTSSGTATTSDYVSRTGVPVTIPAGSTSASFDVSIKGDTVFESDETFYLMLDSVVGAVFYDTEYPTGTILNDDVAPTPTLSIGDVSISEGNSGAQTATFTVALSAAAPSTISFDVATVNGSATAGSDYVALALTGQTIAAGQIGKTVSVTINSDTAVESDETFTVNVTNVAGATVSDGIATGTITNDDFSGPTLSIADVSIAEGNAGTKTMSFTVTMSAAQSGPVYFDIATANGTAAAGSDYVAKTATRLRIPAGNTSKPVVVTIVGDTAAESDETFTVNLSDAIGATIVDNQAVGTIVNDDVAPLPVLSVADVTVAEGDESSHTASFWISLSTPSASPISFDVATADGTATTIRDYTALATHISIPANTTSYLVNVWVFGDTEIESDETFTLTLSNLEGATVGDGHAVATISNDDTGPELSVGNVAIAEGDSGTKLAIFTVNLSEPATADVLYTITTADQTAVAGSDYVAISEGRWIPIGVSSQTFSVTINGDTAVESNETFAVNLSNVSGATVANYQAIGTITNDDVALSIADVSIVEGNSGSAFASFTVTLSAPAAVDVTFNASTSDGSATANSDYGAQSWGLVFHPGSTTLILQVPIAGDTMQEPDETFTINLSNVVGAAISDGSATATITNDDTGGLPTLSVADVSIAEGASGQQNLSFTATLSAPSGQLVTFDFATADGTAISGQDYEGRSSAMFIAAGATSTTFSVLVNGDTAVEPDETFTLALSNVVGATVSDGSATATITNDDAASGPALSIGDISITEGNSRSKTATFTVSLSAAASSPVTYNIATANGSAIAGSDYVAKTLTGQSIPAGSLSKAFSMAIKGDTTTEPNETFLVDVSNVVGATVADGQAVGTIVNDDGGATTPSLSIADVSISESNSGTKVATFTITLSGTSANAVSYDIATANGTATAGSDYVASSLAGQSIAAGGTSKAFAVTINGDTVVESNETFTVTVTNVVGATVADGMATGTISNDDGGGSSPTLSIGDISITEGNSLSKQATFTLTLSAAASGPVTYNIATANGTAIAASDYVAKSLSGLSIPAGSTSKTFTMAIKGDTAVEPNETFLVNVSNVAGATLADGQAVGTIVNDDGATITVARLGTGGLFDDIDDHRGEPVLSGRDYAASLLAQAKVLCERAGTPMLVGVDGVENLAVLADLAATVAGVCPQAPRYDAVLKPGATADNVGFLISHPTTAGAPRMRVQSVDQLATVAGFQVGTRARSALPPPPLAIRLLVETGATESVPLTVVLTKQVATGTRRVTQAKDLAQLIRARTKATPGERLVVLGDFSTRATDAGDLSRLLQDVLVRLAEPLPEAERTLRGREGKQGTRSHVLVSKNLLTDYPGARVETARSKADTDDNSADTATQSERDPQVLVMP
ncbi:MAG: Calx-beta domain-containing protein [Arenimonas sp.]|jgi:hypothetical protein